MKKNKILTLNSFLENNNGYYYVSAEFTQKYEDEVKQIFSTFKIRGAK